MTGSTHIAIAAVATTILSQKTGYVPEGLLSWVVMIIGALIPDIDEPKSTASNPAGLFFKVMPSWVQEVLNTPFQSISVSIRHFFGHRGATHYLLWPLLMGGLAWYYNLPLLAWFAWGYLWHELADWVTRTGIPAAGPFYRKNTSLLPKPLRIKTGSRVEQRLNTLCWLYLLYSIFYLRFATFVT